MASTYVVDSNPINLRERIAALEQRTSTPTPESPQQKQSGIPQLSNNVHLRDKIAKFERKGGVPVPRGRFGMGAPPLDSGKPKKQGELYGNRISRIASASAPRPVPGAQTNRRSVSLSVARGNPQDYDASTPRSVSPSFSDLDTTNSEAPDSEKECFAQEMNSPSSPATEIMEASEDKPIKPSKMNDDIKDVLENAFEVPTEPNNLEAAQIEASTAPEVVPEAVVTESIPVGPEDANTESNVVPQVIITEPALIQPGDVAENSLGSETLPQSPVKEEALPADDITISNKAEETEEVEQQLLKEEVALPPEPEQKHEDESVSNKVDDSTEAMTVVEEALTTSLSRSSSLRTLKPIHHATINTPSADEETTAIPEVPVISLSPPPSVEDVASPAVPSPLELYSPPPSVEDVASPAVPSPLELYSPQGSEHTVASPSSVGSSASSPVEVPSKTSSPVDSTTRIPTRSFTRSPSSTGLSNITVPAKKEDNVGDALTRSPRRDTLSKATTVESPSKPASLSPKEKVSTPTVTVTSPPALKSPDTAPATPVYSLPDQRASTPSPSILSPPTISRVLSPTSDSSSATRSTLVSPTESVSDRKVMTTARRNSLASLPLTNAAEESSDSGMSAALSPISPTSRFRNTPTISVMNDRQNAFHAVVRNKVKETAPSVPTPTSTSRLLAALETPHVKKPRQSGKTEILTSPGTGELVSLLQEATLLEHVLAEGELDLSLDVGASAAQEASRRADEPQNSKEGQQPDYQRGIEYIAPSASKGDESSLGNLKSRLAFRLPLKKKTKHWRTSSTTNSMLQEDMRIRRSLDAERIGAISVPDPAFLKMDPAAAKKERADEAQLNTPKISQGSRQEMSPKSPRLLASFRRFASTGSTKSVQTSGAQPRFSASTWSEISSDDSMPVSTPPDATLSFARSVSKDGVSSSQSYRSSPSHGSNIPWPSMSPKRTLARAASFAEKFFNRGRTRSSGSTLSAREPRTGNSLNTPPRKAASSVNLTSTAPSSFRLDLPTLSPSESLLDSSLSANSPASPLSNPYSPGRSAHTSPAKSSASTPILANRHSPEITAPTDNESWLSDVSQLDSALFDAFPSVPHQPMPTLSRRNGPAGKAADHLPSIYVRNSLSSFSSYDPFATNPPAPRSAQLPKRNVNLPPVPLSAGASVDPAFFARASTIPGQRSTERHSGR